MSTVKGRRRVAVVTGAGQGIGGGIAVALAAAGYVVIATDVDEAAVTKTAERLQTAGGRNWEAQPQGRRLDVREKLDFARVFEEAAADHGGVDVLVNNAALTRSGVYTEITSEEWGEVIAVNLRGVLFGCQVAGPHMSERGFGRILNLTSIAGLRGGPAVQGIHYIASKAGIVGITRYLAYELGPSGVTVNAIAPGPTLTPQTAAAPPEKLEAVRAQVPARRLGTVEEVAAVAVFLASDAAGFVNGAVIDVNGGLLMR